VSDNPFGGLFGDLFNVLGQQGPNAWFETARTLALNVARQEDGDPNPEPAERQRVEQFAPLVARHVGTLFEVAVSDAVTATNRTGLTLAALTQWRPLVQPMVDAPPPSLGLEVEEGVGANLGQLTAALGPLFTGFQVGSVAGHFSERAWSLAALALPRESPEQLLVVNNVAHFAEEWSLDRDQTTVFAIAREIVASLILTQPGTGDALRALLLEGVRDSMAAQGDLISRLSKMVSPEDFAALMGDPESLLDGIEIPEETPATRALNAAVAVLRAGIDAAAFWVCEQIVGPVPQLREAYLRYRLADARGEDAAAALFGIATRGAHHAEADEFVASSVAAHGLSVLSVLLRADGLPSAEELGDPAAWYERVTNSPLA
jgi:uncharacterized protein (DUF2342 family)